MTNTQRHSAALTLAEHHLDKHTLAYFLCQLGLAEHREDERFVSVYDRDEGSWFSRRKELPGDTYRLALGALDDCR